ncbi:LPD29 domain-containing protein [Gemmatimonas sp.]|uniref:LPD29 domain-containing protein n=1 Tax=Gemmatimonas sp. TaxID=1962908 RepID=UPI0033410BBF
MTGTLSAPVQLSTKETAAALRQALKIAFPAVKFSVRKGTGTASAWIDVSYTDGPSEDRVREITAGFQSQQFDGSIDGYNAVRTLVEVAGKGWCRPCCSGIITVRHLSDRFRQRAAEQVAAFYGIDIPAAEWHNAYIPQAGTWFGSLVHQAAHDRTRFAR